MSTNPSLHYICDTNCFYDHAVGRMDLNTLRGSDAELCYSPLSVVEILGKIDIDTFAVRKRVAQAIVQLNPVLLHDPDSYLSTVFGYTPSAPKREQAKRVIEKLANASSLIDIEEEVEICSDWRRAAEDDWLHSLQEAMKEAVPGYANWLAAGMPAGKRPYLRKTAVKDAQRIRLKSEEHIALQIELLHKRAMAHAIPSYAPLSAILAGQTAIECYCALYNRFILEVSTTDMKHEVKQPNDSHDLEYFLYSRDETWVVASGEKFWNRLATDCGMGSRVRRMLPA